MQGAKTVKTKTGRVVVRRDPVTGQIIKDEPKPEGAEAKPKRQPKRPKKAQPKPTAFDVNVDAAPIVRHAQGNRVVGVDQRNLYAAGLAMAGDVGQCLLHNSEHTLLNFQRQRSLTLESKLKADPVLPRPFGGIQIQGGSKTLTIQRQRTQLEDEVGQFLAELIDYIFRFDKMRFGGGGILAYERADAADLSRGGKSLLLDTVVQLTG